MLVANKIRWKNLLSTGNEFIEVNFRSHRNTLIIGTNGVGKSTMLEALMLAAYGKPFRGINKSDLVNSINKRDCLVEFEFQARGSLWLVRRGVKPSVFELYRDSVAIKESDVGDLQAYLEGEVLRMNARAFVQVVILGASSFVPFMKLPAGHRRDVIEDVLDIKVFSAMNAILKERIGGVDAEISDRSHSLRLNGEKLVMQESFERLLAEDAAARQEEARRAVEELESRLALKVAEGVELAARLKETGNPQQELDELLAADQQAKSEAAEARREAARLGKQLKFFEDTTKCPTCETEMSEGHRRAHVLELRALIDARGQDEALALAASKSFSSKADVLRETVRRWRDTYTEMSVTQAACVDLDRQISKARLELQKPKVQATVDPEETERLREAIRADEDALTTLRRKREAMAAAAVLLKDNGIKASVIKQYVPVINRLINKYLAHMDFYVAFELDENFKERIKSRHRDEFSYESFSNGEKLRIDLAIMWAWRDVARLRNSAATNLLVMDEVMDGSLDNDGVDEFLRVIHNLPPENNIFVISHKVDQLLDKFNRTLRFKKVRDFSQVEES